MFLRCCSMGCSRFFADCTTDHHHHGSSWDLKRGLLIRNKWSSKELYLYGVSIQLVIIHRCIYKYIVHAHRQNQTQKEKAKASTRNQRGSTPKTNLQLPPHVSLYTSGLDRWAWTPRGRAGRARHDGWKPRSTPRLDQAQGSWAGRPS